MYSEHKTSPGQIPEASALHKLAPPSKSPCYGGGRCRRSGAYDRALGPKRAKQMETQQSVFGGHTRGDHAGLQPRGEGTKYTWLEAASGPRPVIIGPRTSISTPCVCVGGSKKKGKSTLRPILRRKGRGGPGLHHNNRVFVTTTDTSAEAHPWFRRYRYATEQNQTRGLGMCSAHLMYLERLAAEMQYAWVLVMRSYVLFRATFVIFKSH
jgi:hypothetical protein